MSLNRAHEEKLRMAIAHASERGAIVVSARDPGVGWLPGALPGVAAVASDPRLAKLREERYVAMMERIDRNIADLKGEVGRSRPEDQTPSSSRSDERGASSPPPTADSSARCATRSG